VFLGAIVCREAPRLRRIRSSAWRRLAPCGLQGRWL